MNTRPQRACNQPHGTMARYVAGCSCLPCSDAHVAYQRQYRYEGMARTVDAGPARAHIKWLMMWGWRTRAIAEQAALSYNTIRYVRTGRRTRISKESADAILTLTTVPLATSSSALVPARPTLRVIQTLRRQFSLETIATAAGVSRKSLPQPGQRSVQARTARRIREAAELLRGQVAS